MRGVLAGGGLIDEEQAGLADELNAQTDALALAAGKRTDGGAGALGQLQVGDDFVDAIGNLRGSEVVGQAEPRGIGEALGDSELTMQDVFLGKVPDKAAQGVESSIEVAAVDGDGA